MSSRHRSVRGRVLSGIAVTGISALMMSVPVASQAAEQQGGAAPVPSTGLSEPDSAWTPPENVNRSPEGGVAPAEQWDAPGKERSSKRRTAAAQSSASTVSCESGQATGVLPQYPMERFRISDRVQIGVNTFNGNMVATARDLTIRGTGQNLSLNHVYNSKLSGGGTYGSGWNINAGGDIGLTFEGDDAVLHGASGYCATFTADGSGGFDPAPGVDAELAQLSDGSYELTWNGSNKTWSFTEQGWLSAQADRNGNANTYRYNDDGTLASVTDSQGRVTTFSHDSGGRITGITDPTGTSAGKYTYNDAGRMTTFTDRGGNRYLLNYTDSGNLSRLTLPDYSQYVFSYNSADQVTEVHEPNGTTVAVTEFSYGDHTTTQTDPNGNETVYTYDERGRQIKAVDALGNEQSKTWTPNSDVQTNTNGLNNSTTSEYDRLNNLVGTKLPTGAETTVGYDSSTHPHLPTSITDPQERTKTRSYDEAGNLTEVRSADLDKTLRANTYNSDGTLAKQVNGNGAATTYSYDEAGNLTEIQQPGPLGSITYTYDALSRVTSVTDGNGNTTEYSYDKLDRVVSVSHNGTVSQTMSYNSLGKMTARETSSATTTFTYLRAGLMTEKKRSAGGSTETISYEYDPAGNMVSMTDPNGETTYSYDAGNRLISMTDASGQTTTFGYNAADQRTSVTFPGAGKQTMTYDAAGRQTGITVTDTDGITKFDTSYSYSAPDGSDTTLLQYRNINGTGNSYDYDALQRITSSNSGAGSYGYDTASNITSGPNGTSYTTNAADQLTEKGGTSYDYDSAGNLTGSSDGASYEYSAANQLTGAQLPSGSIDKAVYDTADQTTPRSITETTGGNTVQHVFTHTAMGITSITDNGQRTGYFRDPAGKLITKTGPDGKRYNAITDQRGTVLALLAEDGTIAGSYEYGTYGETTATGKAAEENPFRYNGSYQLDTGDYMFGHRYYDTDTKWFTQTDPSRQESNLYAYAECNPTNLSDPTGLNACSRKYLYGSTVITAGGVVVGGLATGGAAWALGGVFAGASLINAWGGHYEC
ncbi:RHS repeat-associated protein [Actinopolyspora biskrensis]|uniref:RHS repeat-associated protein n=1 Tax=Actinopolyspora biskrensis TaxID=1470178 RepID=A0A852Z897_9ACTN|nr:RHS repeat-associated core domain-containing protein [Actinopolyspora biskrensis]NYH79766.1 RHS repeat-associated protein [Actinopolyspora biskrensis]